MAAHSYADLKPHIGHKVTVVAYGSVKNPANIAIECEDCGCVLMDYDRPPQGRVQEDCARTAKAGNRGQS